MSIARPTAQSTDQETAVSTRPSSRRFFGRRNAEAPAEQAVPEAAPARSVLRPVGPHFVIAPAASGEDQLAKIVGTLKPVADALIVLAAAPDAAPVLREQLPELALIAAARSASTLILAASGLAALSANGRRPAERVANTAGMPVIAPDGMVSIQPDGTLRVSATEGSSERGSWWLCPPAGKPKRLRETVAAEKPRQEQPPANLPALAAPTRPPAPTSVTPLACGFWIRHALAGGTPPFPVFDTALVPPGTRLLVVGTPDRPHLDPADLVDTVSGLPLTGNDLLLSAPWAAPGVLIGLAGALSEHARRPVQAAVGLPVAGADGSPSSRILDRWGNPAWESFLTRLTSNGNHHIVTSASRMAGARWEPISAGVFRAFPYWELEAVPAGLWLRPEQPFERGPRFVRPNPVRPLLFVGEQARPVTQELWEDLGPLLELLPPLGAHRLGLLVHGVVDAGSEAVARFVARMHQLEWLGSDSSAAGLPAGGRPAAPALSPARSTMAPLAVAGPPAMPALPGPAPAAGLPHSVPPAALPVGVTMSGGGLPVPPIPTAGLSSGSDALGGAWSGQRPVTDVELPEGPAAGLSVESPVQGATGGGELGRIQPAGRGAQTTSAFSVDPPSERATTGAAPAAESADEPIDGPLAVPTAGSLGGALAEALAQPPIEEQIDEPDEEPAAGSSEEPAAQIRVFDPAAFGLLSATSSPEARDALRAIIGDQYLRCANRADQVATRLPALRSTTKDDIKPDLVAVMLHHTDTGAPASRAEVAAAARSAQPGRLAPFLICLGSGLRRLPSHHGAVLLGAQASEAELAAYQVGMELVEPAPLTGLTSPAVELAAPVEFAVWSTTGRRTSLFGAPGEEPQVVFPPGTRFIVLDVLSDEDPAVPTRVLLRESTSSVGADTDDRDRSARERLTTWLARRDQTAPGDRRQIERPERFHLTPGVTTA